MSLERGSTVHIINLVHWLHSWCALFRVVMERPYWKLEEELAVVNDVNITADDVIQHAVKLFTDASFLCFAHGNINQELVSVC